MKPLFNRDCKCQKWVDNSNQAQLKPIFFYGGGWGLKIQQIKKI